MRRSLMCVVALALVLSACGGSGKKTISTKPASAAKRKKASAPAVATLTGLPDPTGAARSRCAITVKIDNTQASHPKYGVDQADVVYEEVVEGFYTRLAAVFNSHAPDVVGSVRSVRKSDQSIVWPIGGIFAYSGGAQYAIDSINTAPVVQLDETRAGSMMFRQPVHRTSYLNLYAHVDQMYARCGKQPTPPPPLFSYRAANAPVVGDPVMSARVGFLAGFAVTWIWDTARGAWLRNIFGQPEIVASGAQLAPQNVVVMFTHYVGGDRNNEFAEATLTGTGTAWVLTGGKVIRGTWSRPDKSKPAQLLDGTGAEIKLAPGQTWVELPDASYSVTTTPPAPPTTPSP